MLADACFLSSILPLSRATSERSCTAAANSAIKVTSRGVVPLKCFRCILEEQRKLLYTAAALTSSQEPHGLACGPCCQPKTLHASQGI